MLGEGGTFVFCSTTDDDDDDDDDFEASRRRDLAFRDKEARAPPPFFPGMEDDANGE